ncbi:hypothetical protein HaLaN_15799 [Haematococcus lacustris]|uniref:Uncharacterized protein n=1 Tax=Haematococcus lacustris TaxID=44745 RepID=A0A699Z8E2_HAELA|nr:hypothetical protein HaLaN_15799 [Haematococcus lacustris]
MSPARLHRARIFAKLPSVAHYSAPHQTQASGGSSPQWAISTASTPPTWQQPIHVPAPRPHGSTPSPWGSTLPVRQHPTHRPRGRALHALAGGQQLLHNLQAKPTQPGTPHHNTQEEPCNSHITPGLCKHHSSSAAQGTACWSNRLAELVLPSGGGVAWPGLWVVSAKWLACITSGWADTRVRRAAEISSGMKTCTGSGHKQGPAAATRGIHWRGDELAKTHPKHPSGEQWPVTALLPCSPAADTGPAAVIPPAAGPPAAVPTGTGQPPGSPEPPAAHSQGCATSGIGPGGSQVLASGAAGPGVRALGATGGPQAAWGTACQSTG